MLFNYNINNCGWNNFLDPDWHNVTSYELELPEAKYINSTEVVVDGGLLKKCI